MFLVRTSMIFLIILASFIFSFSATAQTVTYADLEFIIKSSADEVEDYLFKKNFKFDGIDQLDSATYLYRYKLKTSFSTMEKRQYDVLTKQFKNGTCYKATFTTINENNYFQLKNSIRTTGFTIMKTTKENDIVMHEYTKGDFKIDILIRIIQNDELKVKDTMYSISLIDFKLFKVLAGL